MKNWSYTIKEGEHTGKTLWSGRYCAICGIITLFNEGEWYILANKRGSGTPDYQGYWNLPCGYLEADETAEQGVCREILEETGYRINPNDLFVHKIETDPTECNNGNVTLYYHAYLNRMPEFIYKHQGEDNEVDEVQWIKLDNISSYKWAFNHENIIKSFIKFT